jgi:hypothetical protein
MLDRDTDFKVILSNLLFSANNPFQSNFAFVQDMSDKEKVALKINHDYEQCGSLSYIFNRKHLQYKVIAGSTAHDELKNEQGDSYGEMTYSGSGINSMDINSNSLSGSQSAQTASLHEPDKDQDQAFAVSGKDTFLDTARILQQ